MSKEALKLALEALEEVTGWQWAGPMRVMDEVEDAITAIKEALVEQSAIKQCLTPEPAQQTDEFLLRGILASELKCWHRLTEDEEKNLVAFVQNMQSKPAEQQQEPLNRIDVACDIKTLCANGDLPDSFEEIADWIAGGSMPAQQQEPIGWLYPEGLAALKTGKCWTAYGTKQDAECSIPIYNAVAPRVEPRASESGGGFESLPASLTTQEPAQEPVKFKCTVVDDAHPEGVPLSQWGRQPEQRPFCYHDGHNIVGKEYADHSDVFPLYTSPQPAHAQTIKDQEGVIHRLQKRYAELEAKVGKPQAQPAREPLTDEMVKQMKEDFTSMEMRGAFVNGWLSAEAAHGIKE